MIKLIKKAPLFVALFALSAFAQNESEIMKEAFSKFSKSPFASINSSGGAFYSGDDLDQMPVLVEYRMNDEFRSLNVVDGLLGNPIMNAQVINNQLALYISESEKGPMKGNFNDFRFEEPILRFPKMYSDILEYKFIDLNRPILSSNITLGKNWHTLKIGYKDRIDTIIFSASTYRVRSFSVAFMDNVVNVELGSYTTVNNIPYPKEFTVKSKTDNRELRYNVTNVW